MNSHKFSSESTSIYLCECGQVHVETRYHRYTISPEDFSACFSDAEKKEPVRKLRKRFKRVVTLDPI